MTLPAEAAEWVRSHVRPTGPIAVTHERPWSTVLRLPVASGTIWFKACHGPHVFEPRLTAHLFTRWPGLVPEVIAYDEKRSWLLLADAGTRLGDLGNDPEYWLTLLADYAELQRSETAFVAEHLTHGVPDLRVESLPSRYEDLIACQLPLTPAELRTLRELSGRFREICAELSAAPVADTIQHDDLHMNNVFACRGTLRILDWGDTSVSHPFVSLIATFRFLEERNGLDPGDRWFDRLRDAYLEPWGAGLTELFGSAMTAGGFAHAIAALTQRAALGGADRERFDQDLAVRLRRAMRATR